MKEVLTTGEAARLCGVAPRTVSKWFDAGQLRGFRIPGSRDRRIPRDCPIRFMRAHGIPRSTLERESGDVRVASEVLESGLAARQFRPHAVFPDLALPEFNPGAKFRALRSGPERVATRRIAVDTSTTEDRLRE